MVMITNYQLTLYDSPVQLFVMSLVKMTSMDSNPQIFLIIHLIEFAFLFLTVTTLWYLVYCIGKYRLFHHNLVRLIQFFYAFYYVSVLARAVTFAYEIEFFKITGTISDDWPLLICTFLRMEFMVIYMFMVPAMIAERCFASYYVTNYEKKNLSWVAYFLYFCAVITTAVVVIPVMLGYLSFELCLTCLLFGIFCLIIFICIFLFNKRKLSLIDKQNREKYTLSIKFQLVENIRQLIVLSIVILILLLIALFLICCAVIWNDISSINGQISAALFEMWFSISAVVLLSAFVLQNTQFRNGKVALFGHRPSRVSVDASIHRSKVDATKLYFKTLSSYW